MIQFVALFSVVGAEISEFNKIYVKQNSPFIQYAVDELTIFTKTKFSVSDKSGSNTITLEHDETLPLDGYRITLTGTDARLKGNRTGIMYAVHAFLRKFGWEYYGPGCVKAPTRSTGDFFISDKPAFDLIRSVGLNFKNEADAYRQPRVLLRLGYGMGYFDDWTLSTSISAGRIENKGNTQSLHTCELFAPRDKAFIAKHPNFYARDRKGKIKGENSLYGVGGLWHACTSDPELRQAALKQVLNWLDKSPHGKLVWIGQGDGLGWCECRNCLALDPVKMPEGEMTAHMADRHMDFVNFIAREAGKKYPDVKFVFTIYSSTTQVPQRVKPEKNIVLQFCPYLPTARCFSHDLECPTNAVFRKNMREWQSKFPRLPGIIFDYVMNYSNRHAFFFPHDAMEKKIRQYHAEKMRGISFCGEPRILMEYFFYVQGKMLWKPDMTIDELEHIKDDFLKEWYGAAAGSMKKFIKLCSERTKSSCQGIYSGRSEISDSKFISEAYKILEQAQSDVPAHSIYAKRVRYEKAGIIFTDLLHYSIADAAHRLKRLREYRYLCREFPTDIAPSFVKNAWEWVRRDFNIPMNVPKKVHGWQGNRSWHKDKALDVLDKCITDRDFAVLAEKLKAENPEFAVQKISGNIIEVPVKSVKVRAVMQPTEQRVLLYGEETLSFLFRYESDKPFIDGKLILTAKDHDKGGKTSFAVKINGKEIFRGKNTVSKTIYEKMELEIPDNLVKKGGNKVEILNVSPAAPMANWIMFSKIEITPANSDYNEINWSRRFSWWRKKGTKSHLKQDVKKGYCTFTATEPAQTSDTQLYCVFDNLTEGKKYRVSFDIRGTGNMAVPYIILNQNKPWGAVSKWQRVSDISSKRRITVEFTAPEQKKGQRLHFALGDQPTGAKITISNVVLEEKNNQ